MALLLLLFVSLTRAEIQNNWEDDMVVTRDRCTTIAIGKGATSDGSTYATDTNDCHDCDWRMAKVPAMDWPPSSLRPIYAETSSYPRFIREDRGETWKENNLENVPQKEGSSLSSPLLPLLFLSLPLLFLSPLLLT
jgi:hypothetical protein